MEPEGAIPMEVLFLKQEEQDQNDASFVFNEEPAEPAEPEQPKPRRKRQISSQKTYHEAVLNETLDMVQKGGMSTYSAAKHFGIPRTTIQYRLSKRFKNKGGKGPCTVFTADEERHIVAWLTSMEQRGFPITRAVLVHKFSTFLTEHPRSNPFRDNVPGKGFFKGFMKRHPQLPQTNAPSITNIQEWFKTVQIYLMNNGLFTILDDPTRVLTGEECGFYMHPDSKKVTATSWTTNLPYVETSTIKQNITISLTFCADGNIVVPNVIFPQKRLGKTTIESFPSDWGLRPSEDGRMDSKHFILYVTRILHPYLVEKGVQFPVLYFIEGHKSLTALKAADACQKLGIILIALFPEAAKVLYPEDVGICEPLKIHWSQEIKTWKQQTKSPVVTLKHFGTLLKSAMDSAFSPSTIIDAFATYGLIPFNGGNIDPTYVVTQEPSAADVNNIKDPPKADIAVPGHVIEDILDMLGPAKILLYTHEQPENLSHEDRVLAFIYKHILNRTSGSYMSNAEETSDAFAASLMVKAEFCSDSESLQGDAPLPEQTQSESENCQDESGATDTSKQQMADSCQSVETAWIKTESEQKE